MSGLRIGELLQQPSGANEARGPWRRSYDIDDARAQVSNVCWTPSDKNANFFKFRDVFRDTVEKYSQHTREAGKTLPISSNADRVLKALLNLMDGKTARCDPSLDRISEKCGLSRRTVVRQLEALRSLKIIDWVRRTVKTGNPKGEGPQRQQTSNSYFINLTTLPIEMIRTLRQRLGDKLREVARVVAGSGPVPNRMAIKAERLAKSLAGAWGASNRAENTQRRALGVATSGELAAHMYGVDIDARREHAEMLGLSIAPSASAKVALYPGSRSSSRKDRGR